MKPTILYPCDYFNHKEVDEAYKEEYEIAKSLGFNIIFFDYDKFVETKTIGNIPYGWNTYLPILIYRGWMLSVEDYDKLQYQLNANYGWSLINTLHGYKTLHHFNEAYHIIELTYTKLKTPKTIVIAPDGNKWKRFYNQHWGELNLKEEFTDYFMMKDNVKSVKGTKFPSKISVDINDEELFTLVEEFKSHRGNLFTGEIVLKQYVDLKKYGDTTNEWRAFYFWDKLITVSANSNQPKNAIRVPDEVLNSDAMKFLFYDSKFFTVDFAETESGDWILIETGDGQVSGLSPNQNILEFYNKLEINEKRKEEK